MPSSIEQRFLERLKSMQAQYAHEVLSKPSDKTEFGFGRVSGVYEGLLRAEQLFEEIIGEESDRA